jgi:hypothetical protein
MPTPTKITLGKRAPRGTGKEPMITARFPQSLIDQIEAWAKHQKTNRSDAIRRLVEAGLIGKR